MKYIEYKEIFESIVALTEKADELYKKEEFSEADELLAKRDKLMAQLETPDDIDEGKVNYIYSLRDKILEKNMSILKSMKNRKQNIVDELNKELPEEKENVKEHEHDFSPMPKVDLGSSIFNQKKQ